MESYLNNLIIEPMQYSDVDEVATVLTESFYTNPAYAIVFKNKGLLKEGLFWLFKASLIINNQKQQLTTVVKEKKSGEIIGTFTIIPPEGVKKDISVYSKIGIGRFISKFGLGTFIRMLRMDSNNKTILAKSLGNSQHYYLSMVVIKEEYRGKGLGSLVLKHAINNLMDTNPAFRLMALTTQLSENVTFYTRLGFAKIDEGYVTFRGSKYYNYNMKLDLTVY